MIFGTHRNSSSSLRNLFHCVVGQALVEEGVHCKDGRAWAIPLHQNHRARAGRCRAKELEATRAALGQGRVNLQKRHLPQALDQAQLLKKDSRRDCGEDRTAQHRVRRPMPATNRPHAWAHTTATIAMEAQAVRAVEEGGSRARQACRRTHHGWATTIHTAPVTTEAHHHGGRLVEVDALACQVDRACAEGSWYKTDQVLGELACTSMVRYIEHRKVESTALWSTGHTFV